MSHNPSLRCSQTTRQGEPCRAWAVHDTDPPLCSAHSGRNVGAGAPPGNQNRRTHGFFASAITAEELARVTADANLDLELLSARIALGRVMDLLVDTRTRGPKEAGLTPGDCIRLAELAFQGARTIARLLRERRVLAQLEADDAFTRDFCDALDALSDRWAENPWSQATAGRTASEVWEEHR
jgi:hypothetical protein